MALEILNEPLSSATALALINAQLNVSKQLGSLTIVGHSYACGTTQTDSGVSNPEQESMIARLQALLGIHEDNTLDLAESASHITGITNILANNFGGWPGVLQFVLPSNSQQVNSAADVVVTDPIEAVGGACVLIHGCNDYTLGHIAAATADNAQKSLNNAAAAKQAYRAVLSRMRAGVLFGSYVVGGVVTWDSTIAFSAGGAPWGTNVASVIRNSGAAYRYPLIATAAGATVTVTIPTWFTGGVVALCFIGEENGVGHITNTPTNAAGQTLTIPAANQADFPAAGNTFIVRILAEGANTTEEALCTVTAGPVYTLTTRGMNGTAASAHGANAVILWAADTHKVTFSGTATGATGTLQLSGQGTNNQPVACVKRFTLTAADAGATIIATAGGFQTGELNAKTIFDSWWIESGEPPPVVVTNLHHWRYGGDVQDSLADLTAWNTMINAVVAEFTDGWVKVADVYTPFQKRNGTVGIAGTANAAVTTTNTTLLDTRVTTVPVNALVGQILTCNGKTMTITANDNTGSGSSLKCTGASWSGGGNPGNGNLWDTRVAAGDTVVGFTANDSSFVPTKGMRFTSGLASTVSGEILLVTAVVGSHPYYSLTVTRAQAGSTARAMSAGDWLGPLDWMFTDLIHPNIKGHAVYAQLMKATFDVMPVPSTYQIAAVQGAWSQGSQLPHPGGVFDNYYVYPPLAAVPVSAATTAGLQTAHLIYIPKICILTEIACAVTNAGTLASVRLGIYHPDVSRQRPGRLIQDFGTVNAAISDNLGLTGCYQILRPGWYFLSASPTHVTTSATYRMFAANSWAGPQLGASAALAGGANVMGCSQTITPGAALADWNYFGNSMVAASSIIIRVHVRLRMPMYG